jgi:hypothetical protein
MSVLAQSSALIFNSAVVRLLIEQHWPERGALNAAQA